MYNDPIVNEIREIRERLSKKHNFEVGAIFNDIRKRQTSLGSRLVCHEKRRSAEQQHALGPGKFAASKV